MALKLGGTMNLPQAAKKASPVLLEPMMAVEIEVQEELTAAIRSEIQTHRGRVENKLTANGFCEIKADVPVSELLASSSRGLVEFPMEFPGYEAVRDNE